MTQEEQNKHSNPIPSTLLKNRVERVLEELVNGVKPDSTGKEKLIATREQVLTDWKATENALRERELFKEADQVVEFIQNLAPVKTAHDLLKEKMLADKARLQAALNVKPSSLDKAITPNDELTPIR